MPKTRVVFWCDDSGKAPFVGWFAGLPEKAQDKCLVRIERLQEFGHLLRRPEADYLDDGIYELRINHLNVNYRILYFFHGQQLVVFSHGVATQQAAVPKAEMKTAIDRRKQYTASPELHMYLEK